MTSQEIKKQIRETQGMDTKDYTFFGQAVTQGEFAVLIRSVIKDHKCPYCEEPAFVRCGLVAHAIKCKSIPKRSK